MVRIDQRFEGLTLCQREGWQAPRQHPDLLPAHEALQLRELFAELNRTAAVAKRPAEFRAWMRDSEENGKALEEALRGGDTTRADAMMARVAAGCATCHARYRNVPQQGGS
jgi:cytochrome c'